MACLTTEKTSPLTQQKRCSLPGPMGTLNLYPTHQQRRLSERGLMIYKPSKPDIDLIRDFTSSGRRGSTSFCTDATGLHLHHYPQAPRRHSAVNIAGLPGHPGPDTGLSSGWPPTYTPERRHSAVVPGSSPYFSPKTGGVSVCPGSISPTTTSNTSSTFRFTNTSNSQIHHSPKPSHSSACCSGGAHRRGSSTGIPPATTSHCFVATPSINVGNESGPTSLLSNNNNSSETPFGAKGCQKVRLRIQKNPASKDKFELTPIMGSGSINSSSDNVSEAEDRLDLLSHPKLDTRRHSDSATVRKPPHICITPDRPLNRKKGTGIVCSTGDLFRLKCLTSSATEIRCLTKPRKEGSAADSELAESVPDEEPDSPTTVLGNRSRSFDATIVMARKGPGSSWFSRRHQPIAVKLPVPIDSPTITTETSYFPSGASTAAAFRTPILTITNENASKSELIQIPSPPAGSPVSSRTSPEEKTKVAWDKNGFVLDAAVLGIAIENHLRKVDMRRRATFSAIYQPPTSSIPEPKAGSRARSASACVIQMPSRTEESMNKSTSSIRDAPGGRKLSLTTTTSGARLFCWDKGSSSGFSEKPGPSGLSNGKGQQVVPVLTAVSFTNSTGGQPSFETHLHHHVPHHGIASTSYFTALESPSGENFINFRTTEDDIQEEPGKEDGEDTDDDDDEPQETQAFLRGKLEGGGGGDGRAGSSVVTSQVASSSSSSTSYFSSILNRAHPNNNANHNPTRSTSAQPSSSSSSTPTAPGSSSSRANQGGGVSICGAIRDFLLQSIRS